MLYTLISILVLLWLVGMIAHVGGQFINALLVIALAIWLFDFITGRPAGV